MGHIEEIEVLANEIGTMEDLVRKGLIAIWLILIVGAVLIITACLLGFAAPASAYDAKVEIQYGFENTNTSIKVSGFRFYFNNNPVHTETDGLARVTTLFVPLEAKSYSVTMTAYGTLEGADWESPHSTPMEFEYSPADGTYIPRGFMLLNT